MTSPSVVSTNTTVRSTFATPQTVDLPAGLVIGNTVTVYLRTHTNVVLTSWPAGWSQFITYEPGSGDYVYGAWWKVNDTGLTSIDVNFSGAVKLAAIAKQFGGAADPTVDPPEAATITEGSDDSPDPGTVTPTGGSKDYYFDAVGTIQGSQTLPPTYPTGYTDNQLAAGTSDGVSGNNLRVAAAGKQATASSDNPGAFVFNATNLWAATVVAIHPAAGGGTDVTAAGDQALAPLSQDATATHTAPAFTAAGDQALAPLSQDATATTVPPAFTAAGNQALAPLSQDATATHTAPVYTAALDQALAPLSQDATANAFGPEINGSILQSLPSLAQDLTATTTPPAFVATIEQTLVTLGQSATGGAIGAPEGVITQDIPGLQQDVTAVHVVPNFEGVIGQTLVLITQDAQATFASPASEGQLGQVLPFLAQDMAATHTAPTFTAVMDQVLPFISQLLTNVPVYGGTKVFNVMFKKSSRSRVETAVEKYFTTFQIMGGQRIRGQILDIADTTRVTNFHSARRLLRVRPNSPVTASSVIKTEGGQYLLCAEHGEAYLGSIIYHQFKLFVMERTGLWTRRVEVTNAITGVKTQSGSPTNLGTVYYSIEPAGTLTDQLRIPDSKYTLLTNADLDVDDHIDDMVVARVDRQLGIVTAEAK